MAIPASAKTPSKPFKAVVVGGGIVGLSLSHALQLANIDHVVLEKYEKVVSLKGAALMVWPAVARIFDQFGILKGILDTTTPVTYEFQRTPDGSMFKEGNTTQELSRIFDTPSILFDRETLVKHLYEGLPDRSKVLTSKRVERIEHTETGVRVILSDGTVEEGDIVIGADGVHSAVREQMWDYASKNEPTVIPESDKTSFSSEFGGFFAISPMKDSFGLSPSEVNITHGFGNAKLLFTQPGKVYWGFMFKEAYSQPPRKRPAGDAEIHAVAKRFKDVPFTDKITFGDLWESRTRAGLLNIEEGILDRWHAGRIVLVGDSAHKMTADLGIGGNIGIESAVSLCNILHRELKSDHTRQFSNSELTTLFAEYQKDRHARAKVFVELSGKTTRMYSYHTYFGRFFVNYIAPHLAKMQVAKFAESFSNAPKLDYAQTHITNEDAEGWKLADKCKKAASQRGWLTYVVLTSMIGAGVAYAVANGYPRALL